MCHIVPVLRGMSIKFNILVKYLTFKFKLLGYNGILDSTSGGELVKREELKEQNRTQIIEAAKRLFLAQGIQNQRPPDQPGVGNLLRHHV